MADVRCDQSDGERRCEESRASLRRVVVGVNVDVRHVAVRSELSKFATAERLKSGVLREVELGLEHGALVRPIAPGLSLRHTATAPVVGLQTFHLDDVRTELGGIRGRLVREPVVPRHFEHFSAPSCFRCVVTSAPFDLSWIFIVDAFFGPPPFTIIVG